MITPRVTVPVDAVELLKRHMPMLEAAASPAKSEVFVVCGHEAREMHDAIARLSAAPAPEGGAVPDDVRRLVIAARNVAFDAPTQSELRALDIASEAFASRVPWDDEPEALATREEAPTEAGSLKRQVRSLEETQSAFDVMADHFNLDRAQPPAREDAQPVAGYTVRVGNDAANEFNRRFFVNGQQWAKVYGWDKASVEARCKVLAGALTRPAPDALRIKETIQSIKDAADSFRDCSGDEVAGQVIIRCDQALAALQAEQGAK